jgi:hypothetical protein
MLAAALSSSTPGEKRASSVRRRLIFRRPHCTFPNSERSRPVSAASGFQSKKDEDYRPPPRCRTITRQTGGTVREKPELGKDVCRGQSGD